MPFSPEASATFHGNQGDEWGKTWRRSTVGRVFTPDTLEGWLIDRDLTVVASSFAVDGALANGITPPGSITVARNRTILPIDLTGSDLTDPNLYVLAWRMPTTGPIPVSRDYRIFFRAVVDGLLTTIQAHSWNCRPPGSSS